MGASRIKIPYVCIEAATLIPEMGYMGIYPVVGACPGHYSTTYLHGWWWFWPFDGSSIVWRHRGAISKALHDLVEPSLDKLPPVDDQHRHQRLHLVSQVFPVVTLHCTEHYHALCVCVCVLRVVFTGTVI